MLKTLYNDTDSSISIDPKYIVMTTIEPGIDSQPEQKIFILEMTTLFLKPNGRNLKIKKSFESKELAEKYLSDLFETPNNDSFYDIEDLIKGVVNTLVYDCIKSFYSSRIGATPQE